MSVVPNQSYTYGNCPHQSCLHEQQAITDLIKQDKSVAKYTKIIPQRDPNFPVGINTFVRQDHVDLNRNSMKLFYGADNPQTKGKTGNFIQQCTGLATRAYPLDSQGNPVENNIVNLRLKCINTLLEV